MSERLDNENTPQSELDLFIKGDRVWPLGLVLSSGFFAGMYGFFAYGYSDDPASCEANASGDIIPYFPGIDEEAADGEGGAATTNGKVNIAYRFSFFFTAGYYLSLT